MSVTDEDRRVAGACYQTIRLSSLHVDNAESIAIQIARARETGFRRGVEAAAKVCDAYEREYACEIADELAADIRALLPKDST